jgi:hypothetical protein
MMRFRDATIEDLPELTALYAGSLNERDDTLNYPHYDEQSVREMNIAFAHNLLGNPNWFCVVGAVGTVLREDAQGVKQVLGGKAKAFVSGAFQPRPIGSPKRVGFIEMVIVNPRAQRRDVCRKLIQLAAFRFKSAGADVLEMAYTPGSAAETIALKHGIKPYRIVGAYVLDDGTPNGTLPMPKDDE